METVILVFMAFVSIITLLIVLVVIKDILQGAFRREKAGTKEQARVKEEASVEPVSEQIEENVEEEKVLDEDNSITFQAGAKETHSDKYIALKNEDKSYYDEIVKYVQQIEGAKRNLNERYEDFKLGITRLVRLRIKKGVIIAELILPNSDFKNYVSDNKIAVKLAPTVIKVVGGESVKIVKDSLDIVVKAIKEEKERKKELARERRRARRAQQKG